MVGIVFKYFSVSYPGVLNFILLFLKQGFSDNFCIPFGHMVIHVQIPPYIHGTRDICEHAKSTNTANHHLRLAFWFYPSLGQNCGFRLGKHDSVFLIKRCIKTCNKHNLSFFYFFTDSSLNSKYGRATTTKQRLLSIFQFYLNILLLQFTRF